MQWSITEMVNASTFQTFAIVFCTPETLLVGISGALGRKESTFSAETWFEKMQ